MRVLIPVFFLLMPGAAAALDPIDSVVWGVRAGGVMPSYVGADFAGVVGVGILYRHREYQSFALEADLVTTVADGGIAGLDFTTSTLAAYLAWRSQGDVYLKIRAGSLMEYVKLGPSDAFGGGLSGGIAAGLRRGDQLFELELTGIENAAYMVSVAWYF